MQRRNLLKVPVIYAFTLYLHAYTDYAGLGIPVNSNVALHTLQMEMLVPVKHWRLWRKRGFYVPLCDPDF